MLTCWVGDITYFTPNVPVTDVSGPGEHDRVLFQFVAYCLDDLHLERSHLTDFPIGLLANGPDLGLGPLAGPCPAAQFRQQRLYPQAGIGGDSYCGGDIAAKFLGVGVDLDNLLVGLDSPGYVGREQQPTADGQDDVSLREGDMAGAVGVVETAQGQRTVFRDCTLTLWRGYNRRVQGLGKIQKLRGDGSLPCAAASPD